MRPKIGLTCGQHAPTKYRQAMGQAGADVVVIRAGTPDGEAAAAHPDDALSRLDGLLFPGGLDLDPHHYGERETHPTVEAERARDRLELALCRAALAAGTPVLGICRGLQLLNVAAGGTLWQDLPALRHGTAQHLEPGATRDRKRRLHTVAAQPGTLTAALLGTDPVPVNSIHHQAVRHAATGLRVSALAPDGVVEAMESADGKHVLGVQWHPEELWEEDPRHAGLFVSLYRAAVQRTMGR